MAWRFVLQPNGKLARFSDVVDTFTHINLTEKEAFDLAFEDMGRTQAEDKVRAGMEDHRPWMHKVKGDGKERWNDSIDRIKTIYGDGKLAELIAEIEKDE